MASNDTAAAPAVLPPVVRAFLWMIGTLASFILMAVAARELNLGAAGGLDVLDHRAVVGLIGEFVQGRPIEQSIDSFGVLFWRSGGGLAIMLVVMTATGWRYARTSRIRLHLGRNLIHIWAQWGWFFGVAHITLAEVFAIEFTMPIWTLILAWLILREQITRIRVIAVVMGFIGVLFVLRPGVAEVQMAHVAVLGAALGFAFATYVITKRMVTTEAPVTILFYMVLIQFPIALALAWSSWIWPVGEQWLWVGLAGLTGLTSHFCMAKALSLADSTVIVPIDFCRMPLVAVVGWLVYAEVIDIWVLIGAVIIFAGNFLNVWSESRRGRARKMAATTAR